MIKFINLSIKTIAIFGILVLASSLNLKQDYISAAAETSQYKNIAMLDFNKSVTLKQALNHISGDVFIKNISSDILIGSQIQPFYLDFETQNTKNDIASKYEQAELEFVKKINELNDKNIDPETNKLLDIYSDKDLANTEQTTKNSGANSLKVMLLTKDILTLDNIKVDSVIKNVNIVTAQEIETGKKEIEKIEALNLSDTQEQELINQKINENIEKNTTLEEKQALVQLDNAIFDEKAMQESAKKIQIIREVKEIQEGEKVSANPFELKASAASSCHTHGSGSWNWKWGVGFWGGCATLEWKAMYGGTVALVLSTVSLACRVLLNPICIAISAISSFIAGVIAGITLRLYEVARGCPSDKSKIEFGIRPFNKGSVRCG